MLLVVMVVIGVVLVAGDGDIDRAVSRGREFVSHVAAVITGKESDTHGKGAAMYEKKDDTGSSAVKAGPAPSAQAKATPAVKAKPSAKTRPSSSSQALDYSRLQPGWGVARYALPAGSDTLYTLVSREGRYVVNYDPHTRNSRWAAYVLTRAEVGVKGTVRATSFVTDSRLVHKGWASSSSADYTGSGYDRGHLVPSADRDDNRTENRATFIMTNVSPQKPGLNRHVWKSLEGKVREWAAEHDSLYVVTAGVLVGSKGRPLKKIGSGVAVPELFYKAVATRDGDGFQAIGFVIPNIDDCNRDYRVYAVPVDSIETLTGLDIFHLLPSEPKYDKSFWFK